MLITVVCYILLLFHSEAMFAGGLLDTFSCRMVSAFGSFIVSVGFLLSAFATSVSHLYITVGLVTGIPIFSWLNNLV